MRFWIFYRKRTIQIINVIIIIIIIIVLDQIHVFRFKDLFYITYTPCYPSTFNLFFCVFLGSVSLLGYTSNVRAITK